MSSTSALIAQTVENTTLFKRTRTVVLGSIVRLLGFRFRLWHDLEIFDDQG